MNQAEFDAICSKVEETTIGAALLWDKILQKYCYTVKPEYFTMPKCRAMWECATKAFESGDKFDTNIAYGAIRKFGKDEDMIEYIRTCMVSAPADIESAENNVKQVIKWGEIRALKERLYTALDSFDGQESACSVIQDCQNYLHGFSETGAVSLAEIGMKMAENIGKPNKKGIMTGFPTFDNMFRGFMPENLAVIAARPACGKSALTTYMTQNMAMAGKKVLIFSLEMTMEEMAQRYAARISGLPLETIIDNQYDDVTGKQIVSAFDMFYRLPIKIYDRPNVTAELAKSIILQEEGVDVVVVDHVGLLKTNRKFENRNLEIGTISREFKVLAQELKIPIILISQLSRKVTDTQEPDMGDLRDSGELEQNASQILFLWNVDKEQNIKGLVCKKNRQGRTGKVKLFFDGEHMSFNEIDERFDEEDYQNIRSRMNFND